MSLFNLISNIPKPWLNIRCNDATIDGIFTPNLSEFNNVTNTSKRIGNIVDISIIGTVINGLNGNTPVPIGTIDAEPHDTTVIGLCSINTPTTDIAIANIEVNGTIQILPINMEPPGTIIQIHTVYFLT